MEATTAVERTQDAPALGTQAAGKYLTFALGAEEYGVPVLRAREIIKLMEITTVPQVPVHVKGVVNLRGKVIPVIDLRVRFGLGARDCDERTCIVVVEVTGAAGRTLVGLIVDAVSEVVTINADEIEATPDFGTRVATEFIRGIAKVKGRVKILLELDRVFDAEAAIEMSA